jgi:hypothetical protein
MDKAPLTKKLVLDDSGFECACTTSDDSSTPTEEGSVIVVGGN